MSLKLEAQTNKDIQGTWRVIATTITADGTVFKMDSATHNLTKTITRSRVIFTVYDKKTDSLLGTGQGMASTRGNQYIERFEQSTDKSMLEKPAVFTYKVQGNKLSYEGGTKEYHIVEVLRRIE
ncbi:MAG: hypothetical protein ABI402_21485 [Ferruginibacter sp.]